MQDKKQESKAHKRNTELAKQIAEETAKISSKISLKISLRDLRQNKTEKMFLKIRIPLKLTWNKKFLAVHKNLRRQYTERVKLNNEALERARNSRVQGKNLLVKGGNAKCLYFSFIC